MHSCKSSCFKQRKWASAPVPHQTSKQPKCRYSFPHLEMRKSIKIHIEPVRNTQNKTKMVVEYKRNNPYINKYNCTLLRAWRANIDVSFVCNATGPAYYAAMYASKADNSNDTFRMAVMAALQKDSQNEIDSDLQRQLKHVAMASTLRKSAACASHVDQNITNAQHSSMRPLLTFNNLRYHKRHLVDRQWRIHAYV